MPALTEPIQVLFSRAEVNRLQSIAHAAGQSLDSLIRQAVEEKYLSEEQQDRLEAVRRMAALDLPVAGWEQMEHESVPESSVE